MIVYLIYYLRDQVFINIDFEVHSFSLFEHYFFFYLSFEAFVSNYYFHFYFPFGFYCSIELNLFEIYLLSLPSHSIYLPVQSNFLLPVFAYFYYRHFINLKILIQELIAQHQIEIYW